MPRFSETSIIIEQENELLLELVGSLAKAKDSSKIFASTMKRARKRSTDAKRAMILSNTLTGTKPKEDIRFDLSHQKKIDLAQAELRHLDSVRLSLGQAETVVSLQDTSARLAEELEEANRKLRHLRTENSRREKELDKLSKNPLDLTRMEDSLRRELYSIRSRNSTLQRSIESNEAACSSCFEIETRLRAELEGLKAESASARSECPNPEDQLEERQSALEEEIKGLRAEREELRVKLDSMRESNASKLVELELIVKSIKESRQNSIAPTPELQVSPRTPIQATPIQVSPPREECNMNATIASPVPIMQDLLEEPGDVRHVESLIVEEESPCPELESDLPHRSSIVSMIEPFSLPVSPDGFEGPTQLIPDLSEVDARQESSVSPQGFEGSTQLIQDQSEVHDAREKTIEIRPEHSEEAEETQLDVPEARFEVSDSGQESSWSYTEKFDKVQEDPILDQCVGEIEPRRLFQSAAVTQQDCEHLGERLCSPVRNPSSALLINSAPRIFVVSSRESIDSARSSAVN